MHSPYDHPPLKSWNHLDQDLTGTSEVRDINDCSGLFDHPPRHCARPPSCSVCVNFSRTTISKEALSLGTTVCFVLERGREIPTTEEHQEGRDSYYCNCCSSCRFSMGSLLPLLAALCAHCGDAALSLHDQISPSSSATLALRWTRETSSEQRPCSSKPAPATRTGTCRGACTMRFADSSTSTPRLTRLRRGRSRDSQHFAPTPKIGTTCSRPVAKRSGAAP